LKKIEKLWGLWPTPAP